jgi:hypothetical protein
MKYYNFKINWLTTNVLRTADLEQLIFAQLLRKFLDVHGNGAFIAPFTNYGRV